MNFDIGVRGIYFFEIGIGGYLGRRSGVCGESEDSFVSRDEGV